VLEKTKCIALNSVKYSDSSIIARLYSKEYGRISLMIKGVSNRKKGKHIIMFQPLFILDLEMYYKSSRELQIIKESTVSFAPYNIYSDVKKSCVAIFLGEVLASMLKEESPNTELFDFIENSIKYYDQSDNGFANFHLAFLAGLSAFLGLEPAIKTNDNQIFFDMKNGRFSETLPVHEYYSNAENSSILARIFASSFDSIKDIPLTGNQRNEILEELLGYYNLHLPGLTSIKSLEVLKEIFR
jgi:DNA repair protein RecO (recombination protein O)